MSDKLTQEEFDDLMDDLTIAAFTYNRDHDENDGIRLAHIQVKIKAAYAAVLDGWISVKDKLPIEA